MTARRTISKKTKLPSCCINMSISCTIDLKEMLPQKNNLMAEFKDVVIIGNGPSGISLSYMLTGNRPHYTATSHPNSYLHSRLAGKADVSIVEQNLQELSAGLEGRSKNPVSLLFDSLCHPDADLGSDLSTSLVWKHNKDHQIDHVVIGSGPPGGSWHKMDGSILTISLGSWMELPDFSFKEWETLRFGQSTLRQNRTPAARIAEYYKDYIRCKHLADQFKNQAVVESVKPLDTSMNKEHLWEVKGQQSGLPFSYITPRVVLAVGQSDTPKKLDVPGENLPFVLHRISQLEDVLNRNPLYSSLMKILVVGAGLSAADAIITARFHGASVMHIFRRHVDDAELIFNRLPGNLYPEYHKVHQMMSSSNQYQGYKAYSQYAVKEIKENRTVVLQSLTSDNVLTVEATYIFISIGCKPDLDFLPHKDQKLGIVKKLPVDCKNNPIEINPFTYETVAYNGLYAMGPLVGDNFVRFAQGGALAITKHIWDEVKHKENLCS